MSNIQDSSNPMMGIIEILTKIKNKITPNTDVIWTGYDAPDQLKKTIDWHIETLKNGAFE